MAGARLDQMVQVSVGVLLLSLFVDATFAVTPTCTSGLSLPLRPPVQLQHSSARVALRLRGGADLEAEVNLKDEAEEAQARQSAAQTGGEKRCPHGVPMDSDEECHRCEVLAFMQRSAFVLQKTGGTANSSQFCALWGECFPNLPVMSPEASRTHVAKALNATGYFDVAPIAGSEEMQFTFNEKAAKMCPHGVPLNSTDRCPLCEKISFLQRSARIVGEAGGSINSTQFSVNWNQIFNATTEMTPQDAATQVAQILQESGFFFVIDTEDDNVKTFALRPQGQPTCPHGAPRDENCQLCSRIRFIQACAHVLEQGGNRLTSAEFSAKWTQVFPKQPEIPPETAAKEVAQAMFESGIFRITPTGNGDEKVFEFEDEEAIAAYKKRLDAEVAASQQARKATMGGGQGPPATATESPSAASEAGLDVTGSSPGVPGPGVSGEADAGGGASSGGKVGLGALVD